MFARPSLLTKGLLLGVAGGAGLYLAKDKMAFATNEVALDPKNFKSFVLSEKQKVTSNTNLYRFSLDNKNQELGLPTASCLIVQAPVGPDNKNVSRPYTPISDAHAKGHFDLIVKTYPGGVMSQHLDSLKVGDSLEAKGPFPKVKYTANEKSNIGMVAGGTGITPMYQVIKEALRNPKDTTKFSLLYANVSENDIILRNELDQLAAKHPERFQVHYIIDKSSRGWKYDTGYINTSHLTKYLPPPSPVNMIYVCGPPGLMNLISGDKAKDFSQGPLTGLLKQLSYSENQVYKF
eukprot:TRINITY_DN8420_c0_g1_i1.p1 TRINITY_DN8420_c0_g1~~TRINITY_DN8420_c0_g1_i1.p1  ORF type:complete len:310 (+),score=130.47 TRINITY_DN8420_c0_g1_i1:55-930(+)